jgi:hypothetical protein
MNLETGPTVASGNPIGIHGPLDRVGEFAWYGAALLLVLALAGLRLDDPLHGDQALFLAYAREMGEGARLYGDVWDIKQPGIFAFSWLAGTLFGFTFRGYHLLGLLWMMVTAVVLILALRPRLRHPWIAVVAPVASIGVYYVQAEPQFQTQLEILIALPLLLVALALARFPDQPRGGASLAFAAGMLAAVATVFKHVFAPIPVAMVLVATVACLAAERERRIRTVLLSLWLPFALGVVLVWGAVAGAFWATGAFEPFFFTNFVFPLNALGQGVAGAPLGRLIGTLAFFVGAFAPWWIFVVLTVPLLVRRRGSLLPWMMWSWLAAGLAGVLVQVNGWWAYHMLVLFVPAGVLAALGVDRACGWLRDSGPGTPLNAMALSTLLVLPGVGGLIHPAGELAQRYMTYAVYGAVDLEGFRRMVSEDYRTVVQPVAFLEANRASGPIFVFGSPVITFLSGRSQAIPMHGWASELILESQWRDLADRLMESRPPYIFVEARVNAPMIRRRVPDLGQWLDQTYTVGWTGAYGQWLVRNDVPVIEALPPTAPRS